MSPTVYALFYSAATTLAIGSPIAVFGYFVVKLTK